MTLLLESILIKTAGLANVKKFGVRIVWVTSLLQAGTPVGGMQFESDGTPVILKKFMENYMQSKVGAAWLGADFAERLGKHGIMSVVGPSFLCLGGFFADADTEPSSWPHEDGFAETLGASREVADGKLPFSVDDGVVLTTVNEEHSLQALRVRCILRAICWFLPGCKARAKRWTSDGVGSSSRSASRRCFWVEESG